MYLWFYLPTLYLMPSCPRSACRIPKNRRWKPKLYLISDKIRRYRKKVKTLKRAHLLLFPSTRRYGLKRKRTMRYPINKYKTQKLLKPQQRDIKYRIHQYRRTLARTWPTLLFRLSNSRRKAFLLMKGHPNDHICLISRPRKLRAREANRLTRRTIRRLFRAFPELTNNLLRIRGVKKIGLVRIPFRQVRVALRWVKMRKLFYLTRVSLPRAHGFRTLKKWARRKKRLQKRRSKFARHVT